MWDVRRRYGDRREYFRGRDIVVVIVDVIDRTTRGRSRRTVDIDVEIGDCVRLGGTADAATIDEAVCGSDKSNYKVVGKAAKNAQCASDVDQGTTRPAGATNVVRCASTSTG